MIDWIKAGDTSVIVPLFIQDSTKTDGSGLGGLVFNSASLACKYKRQGDASYTTVTLVTATVGTWVSGGFKEDTSGSTGDYELHLPNAAVASGAKWVAIELYGAANMVPIRGRIPLKAVDAQDAAAFGLSRLDATISSRGTSNLTQAQVTGGAFPIATDGSGNVKLTPASDPNVHSGTAQAGGASTITLDSGASATTNLYVGQRVKITGGTGAGQSRTIISYVGATKVATVDRNWAVNPDNTSVFAVIDADAPAVNSSLQVTIPQAFPANFASIGIDGLGNFTGSIGSVAGDVVGSVQGDVQGNISGSLGGGVGGDVQGKVLGNGASAFTNVGVLAFNDNGNPIASAANLALLLPLAPIRTGTAQAGGASTITLDSGASATDNFYVGRLVKITSGPGAGQDRTVKGYVGATKVATVDWAWITQPTSASGFAILDANAAALNSSLKPAVTLAPADVSGNLPVDLQTIKGQVVTATGAYSFDAQTVTQTSVGTILGRIPGTVQPQTGDSFARLGAPAGASVSADIAAVKSSVGTPMQQGAQVVLASNGLDQISAAAPTGAPSSWTWAQKMMWLFRRFVRSTYDSNAGTIKTFDATGTQISTQTATSNAGVQSTGELS